MQRCGAKMGEICTKIPTYQNGFLKNKSLKNEKKRIFAIKQLKKPKFGRLFFIQKSAIIK
jgi:pimeloyl-CoA synthetase